jgi:outer membrane protein
VKYNFNPQGTFRPYIGVGVNFTMIMDVKLAVPVATPVVLDLDRTSVGLAGQAGFDVKVADQWFLSADLKYVKIGADVKVKANGATLTTAKVDPFIFGVGVGYRF